MRLAGDMLALESIPLDRILETLSLLFLLSVSLEVNVLLPQHGATTDRPKGNRAIDHELKVSKSVRQKQKQIKQTKTFSFLYVGSLM